MSRAKSVILSKEETKQLISGLRNQIKDTKTVIKTENIGIKTAEKAYAATRKAFDKTAATHAKNLEKLEAQLTAMTTPSPV